MSIRLRLSLLLVVLFLAAIFNLIFTFQLEVHGEKKLQWVNHTHEVINVTQTLLGAMTDVETGQRGYLLTINLSYLEPYHNGIVAAKDNLAKLKKLTLDNPDQQNILNSVEKEMLFKFDEMEKTVELVQSGHKNKAIEIVTQDIGKKHMDKIRADFRLFINAELVLLEKRKGDFRANRTQITTLIAIEIIFFLSLAIITFTFLQRSLFGPLNILLSSAKKLEDGNRLEVRDLIEKNEMGNLLSTFFNMGEKVYQRTQVLEHKAHHDELTGLKNRITLSQEIEETISSSQKVGAKFAVLYLDLNLFKKVNDTQGHDVGDLILKETADRLNDSVRSSDSVFRVGGDEFLIIVRNIKDIKEAHSVVNNILNAFDEPGIIKGDPMTISISIGVAISPDDTNNSDEIIKFSDVAMFAAKREKGTSYKMFDKSMLRRSGDPGTKN